MVEQDERFIQLKGTWMFVFNAWYFKMQFQNSDLDC